MKTDFSKMHHIFLRNREDGLLRRMDEPYYTSQLIADGVWLVTSEGCNTYLIEGDKEAIVIDTGYGAGNIREFCQMLTSRPVRRVINTHDHFDHTALNGFFESAIMSEKTAPLATIPFPSFEGVLFPDTYAKEIVRDGDFLDIGNRRVTFFEIPDHAAGSIAILDEKSKILFTGDEVGRFGKDVKGCLETVGKQFRHLQEYRGKYQWLCQGHMGKTDAKMIDQIVENIRFILAGNEGEKETKPPFKLPDPERDAEGNQIWIRDLPHPGDVHPKDPAEREFQRMSRYAGCEIKYDIRLVQER